MGLDNCDPEADMPKKTQPPTLDSLAKAAVLRYQRIRDEAIEESIAVVLRSKRPELTEEGVETYIGLLMPKCSMLSPKLPPGGNRPKAKCSGKGRSGGPKPPPKEVIHTPHPQEAAEERSWEIHRLIEERRRNSSG